LIWLDALQKSIHLGQACVVVTVSAVDGSAPRKVGSRMLVNVDGVVDTIGGGALEQQAIAHSQSLLEKASPSAIVESHSAILGTDFSQCCGGRVTLNYEYHPACMFKVVVFGAGHVAQCVATLLAQLPCRAHFYDSRKLWLNKLPTASTAQGIISANVLGDSSFLTVEQCPDSAYFLVMTHSHELDFELVEAILSRGDSVYCGLIASKSKSARFRSRLSRKGFTESELKKLTAPIGAAQHTGNLPMEVAIAAISEMLQLKNKRELTDNSNKSVPKPHSTSLTSSIVVAIDTRTDEIGGLIVLAGNLQQL